MVRFKEWLLDEMSRFKMQDPTQAGNFHTKEPQIGDIVIDRPEAFFKSPGKNKDLQNIAGNLFLINKSDGSSLSTQNISRSKPPIHFKTKDLADLTFYIPAEGRRVLPTKESNVWIYMPADPNYDIFRKKMEMLKGKAPMAPEDERIAISRLKTGLGVSGEPTQMAGYVKLDARIKEMLKQNMKDQATLELKRAFADDPNTQQPSFIRSLRKNNLHTLADFLEGKDITQSQDELDRRMKQKAMVPAMPAKSNVEDIFARALQKAKTPVSTDSLEAKWDAAFSGTPTPKRQPVSPEVAKFQRMWKQPVAAEGYKHYPLD